MSRSDEIKEIAQGLAGYLEFQSRMGCGKIVTGAQKIPAGTGETERTAGKPEAKSAEKISGEKRPQRISVASGLFESGGLKNLDEVRAELGDCSRCGLHAARKTIVFGEGNPKAQLAFVGEGPGKDEDEQGRPFVGRAGKLLDKIIAAMGMKRGDVYICNVVKCRPPGNRNPEPDEVAHCEPFLTAQLKSISPRVIVCLGLVAAKSLLKLQSPSLGALRGIFHSYNGVNLAVTYHPAALLRFEKYKRPLWEDMKMVMAELEKPARP